MPTITWAGAGNASWAVANNWNPKQVPVNGDDVTVGGNPYIGTTAVAQTLTINGGGEVDISGSKAAADGSLVIGTSIANSGKLMLEGGPFTAILEFAPSSTLGAVQISGGGTVTLSDSTDNSIIASAMGATLTNSNTISGAGQFGNGSAIALINNGVINATGMKNQLVMLMSETATNNSTIEATGAAGLNIQSTINSSGSGVINANGGNVFLTDGTLSGGTLQTSGGGVIETAGNANTISSLANMGSVHVNDATSLTVAGAIANNGMIQMLSTGDQTYLAAAATGTTLSGTGTVLLTDNAHNVITGSGAGSTLNIVANIITGAGMIGGNGLTVNNAGAIIAIGVNNPLIVETGTFTNNGLLSATGPAGLQIVGTMVNGSGGGQITANAPGAVVQLNDAHLMGGTLRTAGSGAQIEAVGQSSILDGTVTTLGNTGTVSIAGSGTALQIIGTISNSGTFTISGGGELVVGTQDATLSGGGTVTLNAASANTVTGEGASDFDNQNNTISGSGSFVDMTLTNGGTIDANSPSVPLMLRTAHTITNNGLFEAVTGTLAISDTVIGSGTALIAAGGTMSFGAGFQENLAYSGAGALILSQAYGGTISGFGSGDTVALTNLPYKTSYVPVWQSNGTLAIEDSANGNAVVATLAFSGNYGSASFALSDDNNATLIAGTGEVSPPSFPANPGNNDEWILSGGHWQASAGPGSHPSGYNVALIGDWTGGGTDGILWFNPTTGDTDEWQLSNTQWSASVDLGTHPANATDGASYQIAGTDDSTDFTGNGIDDVLWTSANSDGTIATDIWELGSNGKWAASVSFGAHPAGYAVAGTGDWTGDGTDGVLWYNASTGDTDEWQLSNGQWAASVDLGAHPGSGWTIAGTGDFFGNGIDGILWTNSSGGQVQTDIWELGTDGQWISSMSPGSHPAGYQVAGVGDFTGNGTSDILWYNASTGDADEWVIDNGQWAGSIDLGSHPGNFQIAGVGSFTGNGVSDILWHSPS